MAITTRGNPPTGGNSWDVLQTTENGLLAAEYWNRVRNLEIRESQSHHQVQEWNGSLGNLSYFLNTRLNKRSLCYAVLMHFFCRVVSFEATFWSLLKRFPNIRTPGLKEIQPQPWLKSPLWSETLKDTKATYGNSNLCWGMEKVFMVGKFWAKK